MTIICQEIWERYLVRGHSVKKRKALGSVPGTTKRKTFEEACENKMLRHTKDAKEDAEACWEAGRQP